MKRHARTQLESGMRVEDVEEGRGGGKEERTLKDRRGRG